MKWLIENAASAVGHALRSLENGLNEKQAARCASLLTALAAAVSAAAALRDALSSEEDEDTDTPPA